MVLQLHKAQRQVFFVMVLQIIILKNGSTDLGSLTGTLPAVSGANLTTLNASELDSGTVPNVNRLGCYNFKILRD